MKNKKITQLLKEMEAIEKEVAQIAEYVDKLEVMEKYFKE
jgi:hypothetical protein